MLSATSFDEDFALEPIGERRWRGGVPRSWFVVTGPNGGFFAGLAVNALARVTDAPPRSLTIHYLQAPVEGPIDVECIVERAGSSTTFCRLVFEQKEQPVAVALAACAQARSGQPEWLDAVPPDVPGPDALRRLEQREDVPPYLSKYDVRLVRPDAGARPARVTAWLRSAEPRPADAAIVGAMTDALFPPAFVRLGERVFVPTIDLTVHWRGPLPEGGHPWILGTFTSRTGFGGVCEEDGELWSADGVLLAQSRQLAIIRQPR